MTENTLMVVYQDGTHRRIPNNYRSIKNSMNGATITGVPLPEGHAFYVDDEGMLDGLTFNIPASIFSSRLLCGPVVLCGPTDDDGNTLPPTAKFVEGLAALANMWHAVMLDAQHLNQTVLMTANADTLPPPQMITLTNEQFDAWLKGDFDPNG